MTTEVFLYGCRTPGTGGFYWRRDRYEAEQLRQEDLRNGCQCTEVIRTEVPRHRPEAITQYIDKRLTKLWDRQWVKP